MTRSSTIKSRLAAQGFSAQDVASVEAGLRDVRAGRIHTAREVEESIFVR